MSKRIACVGDPSTHGGTIISSGQDGRFKVAGVVACGEGAQLNCPTHGIQTIVPITVRSKVNLHLIITEGAAAPCGAVITPPDRGVFVE